MRKCWEKWQAISQHTMVLLATVWTMECSLANPVLDHVSSGNVTIQQTATTTQVNQASQEAIIHWNSFNIGSVEHTQFVQPNSSAVALNRISPTQGASQIFGQLSANGRIILVNQAGIFFGSGSQVDVSALIVSTRDITNANFLAGQYIFDQASIYSGAVINQGTITAAEHGLVALIGNNVRNDGMIHARLVNIVLGSGNKFTLDLYGDQLINFSVDEGSTSASTDQNGQVMRDGVKNTGSLIADGGTVLVSAKAAEGVLDRAINMEGVAQARSIQQQGGDIILGGDPDAGVVRVAAKVDASGKNAGEKGGKVVITGHNILLDSAADIDASGDKVAGTIYIGGNYLGQGPLPNANATVMAPDAVLSADALTLGNGGEIILWSDAVTKAYGTINVRGGALGGDGGFIETSIHDFLDVAGLRVNTTAPYGATGTWLIDPRDITISTGTTANGSFDGGSPTNTFTSTGNSSVLNRDTLQTNLGNTHVNVVTGSGGAQAGDITVSDTITWTSTNNLTLTASNNIVINAAITGSSGGLILTAGQAADTITVTAAIDVNNFNLTRGIWSQVTDPLPGFTVNNNFQINSGTMPNSTARFVRATAGAGTSGDPYIIADLYGLQGIGSDSTTLSKYYKLSGNIDLAATQNWNSGAGWVPIGNELASSSFTGSFNGDNFVIDNLYINGSRATSALFGVTGSSTTIQNIGVTNASVTSTNTTNFTTGILVGQQVSGGTIDNAYTSGTVSGKNTTGGLTGGAFGTISNSYNLANATQSDNSYSVGGLSGYFTGSIVRSYNAGKITGGTAGGLAGFSDLGASTTNSYNTGNVSGTLFAGGLLGRHSSSSTISNSYSTGIVSGAADVGGVVGFNSASTISAVYWDTETSGTSTGVGSGSSTGATGLTTAQALAQSNYSGWDFTTVWNIIEGTSYPYLRAFHSSTPRVISGTAASVGGDVSVILAGDGAAISTIKTGANSSFYYLASNGAIADSTNLLAYISGNATKGNVVMLAPASGASVTGLTMVANTIATGTSGSSSLTNTLLGTAKGALSSTDILYSVSGANLTLGNATNTTASLTATSGTTYTIDGTIATVASGTSTLNLSGPITISGSSVSTSGNQTYGGTTTLGATTSLTSTGGAISMAAVTGAGFGLTLSNATSSSITGVLGGTSTTLTKQGSGTLTLSGNNTYTGLTTISVG